MVIDEIEFPVDPGQQSEHRSFAIAAILCSVTFLESSLNELFASASEERLEVGGGLGGLTERERQTLRDVTGMVDRNRLLDKFQLVLHLLGREPFDRGAGPYQDADLLVKLRNVLVHSKPSWEAWGVPEDKLMKSLLGKHFSTHPFINVNPTTLAPFFPDRCLGADCARWALHAARSFGDAFFDRLGVAPAYAIRHGRRGRVN